MCERAHMPMHVHVEMERGCLVYRQIIVHHDKLHKREGVFGFMVPEGYGPQ